MRKKHTRMDTSQFGSGVPPREQFQTTIWSEVIRAGDANDAQSAEALEKLCQNYWFPIYAYVRRRGHDAHEAQDLTQGFFSLLLEKNYLRTADHSKGKFRSFLINAVKWHLANEWDRANAKKRGGDSVVFSLDEDEAEERYQHEPPSEAEPEQAYDRQWARAILEQVMSRLRNEFANDASAERFDLLVSAMMGKSDAQPYAEIARQLNLSEGAVKSAVRRMRQRLGELFRAEIAATVATVSEIDEETHYLLSLLRD